MNNPYNQSDSNIMYFPTTLMRTVATNIASYATKAQSQHDTEWQSMQHYLNIQCHEEIRPDMLDNLKPLAAQVCASYDWQISLAKALLAAADAIDQTDQAIANGFNGAPL